MHIPHSGILMQANTVIAEHWLYLPTMGMFVGLGESLGRLSMHWQIRNIRPILGGLIMLVLCLFGFMTFLQNRIWRDPVTFYTHIFDAGEDSSNLRNNLGVVYGEKEDYMQALEQFRRSLALFEKNAEAHYNLGAVMILADHSQALVMEGVTHFQRALEIDPDYYKAYEGLAYVSAHLGDRTGESEYLAKAAAIKKKLKID
jgi:tetratricopeptide (TPR) repeat protein